MNDRNLDLESLPPPVLENVLCRLSGVDLHTCRQTNQQINNFILTQIWGRKSNRRILKQRLEENFRTENFSVKENVINGEFEESFVEKVTSRKVLIRTYFDKPIINASLMIFDTKNDSVWMISDVSSHLNGLEAFDNFQTILTDTLFGTIIHLKGVTADGDKFANIRIFNIATRRQMFNENLVNVQFVATEKYENPNTVVIFGDIVEVLQFSDHENLRRFNIESSNTLFAFGYVFRKYITQCLRHQGLNTDKEVKVWEMDKNNMILGLHAHVPSIQNFLMQENGGGTNKIVDILYLESVFVISLEIPKAFDGVDIIVDPTIMIVGKSGKVLKQLVLCESQSDHFTIEFSIYGSRLFMETNNDDIKIYKYNIEDLEHKELIFNKMEELEGGEKMIDKFNAYQVKMNERKLTIKTLQFWGHNM